MVSYGPVPQNRTKRLLKALLDFVNYKLLCGDNIDNIRLEWKWEDKNSDRPKLIVTTTLKDLKELIQNDCEESLTIDNIRNCLNDYLKEYLGILQDHRTKRTSPKWHFTLQLWRGGTADNLKKFDEEWTCRHPHPQTSQSSDEEEELDLNPLPSLSQRTPQNLPHSGVRRFVGRDETLDCLHQQLQQNDRVAISAVTGMGGIGKTELALQYARKYRQEYQGGICWLSARDADVGLEIVNFARVHFDVNPPDDLPLEDRVRYCWHHWPIEGDILTILDDVTDYNRIKPFLPPDNRRFKIVITTRSQRLSYAFENLNLEILTKDAALELLQSLIGEGRVEKELEVAEKLCQWLGYLPLGLELVGQYLAKREDLVLVEMRMRLEEQGLEQTALVEYTIGATAKRGVKAAFELSWQDLPENAREVAYVLSLFAVAPIPWGVVKKYFYQWDKEYLEDIRDGILVQSSFLQYLEASWFQLHPLLQEFIRDKLEESEAAETLKIEYCRMMVSTAKQIPRMPTLEDIKQATPMIPHLQEMVKNFYTFLSEKNLTSPFIGLESWHKEQRFYSQAELWRKQYCSIYRL